MTLNSYLKLFTGRDIIIPLTLSQRGNYLENLAFYRPV
jgi:hypothetical protein